jgi:hypothetical protein
MRSKRGLALDVLVKQKRPTSGRMRQFAFLFQNLLGAMA